MNTEPSPVHFDFFRSQCKDRYLSSNFQSLDNYLAHPTFFLLPLYILHKNESKNRPGDYGGNST